MDTGAVLYAGRLLLLANVSHSQAHLLSVNLDVLQDLMGTLLETSFRVHVIIYRCLKVASITLLVGSYHRSSFRDAVLIIYQIFDYCLTFTSEVRVMCDL
jgi:hypothetical protein